MVVSYKHLKLRRNVCKQDLPSAALAVLVLILIGWLIGNPSLAKQERLFSAASAVPHVNGRISFTNDNLIHSINPDGSDDKVLSTASGLSGFSDHNSSWSADGTRIAFSRRPFTGGPAAIWVMDADGRNPHQISPSASGDIQPTWSPDGTKIAFVREGHNKGDIFVMNADGSAAHSIISTLKLACLVIDNLEVKL